MKKTLYLLLILALSLAGTACSDNDEPKLPEPEIVTVSDFNISSLDCEWNNEKLESDKLYIVSSAAELAKITLCPEEGTEISPIDFDKKTLLVVRGQSTYGIVKAHRELLKYDDNTGAYDAKYLLAVSIETNAATVVQPWVVAVLTDKLSTNSKVEYLEVKW